MITVHGQPQGKARPRIIKIGGFSRLKAAEQTVVYENLIKMEYQTQNGEYHGQDKQLKINLFAYYEVPKSFSKKKREEALCGQLRPQTKPDIDNIAKAYMDALNGIAYGDDKQIIELFITKEYAVQPRVEFMIEEVLIN